MMEEIENEIRRLNKDEEFTEFLSREEDVRKLTNTLLHHAKDDGIKESQIGAAENLLSEGININKIFEILNVEDKDTQNEIRQLSKKIKKTNENEDELIRNTIYEKEINQGIEQKTKEIVRNLLKMKMNLKDISKATGLSIKEIKNL